ncbi:DeoR/GlpR family DNA-binding transcription regulator [Nocardioides stalactiti]|uniref:DeoR/GlpR family DNA-binding transcription regulator n=1 Tax=Nocardioides stalactiti TaxID=2755356 RepID=UPI0015FEFA1A|nr:DeoR/GlpR family DNA-binding transcription regulator [Nocardioides stalactiti]
MYAEERQQAMARAVAARGRMSVAELATEYDVTTETVRRDLSALEVMGLLRRVHGGAVPASALTSLEHGLAVRDTAQVDEKDAIARRALALLPPAGGSIVLDAGSTTVRLAECIPRDRRLIVFTHSVPVAARLVANPAVELHLLPGIVRPTTQAAVGPETVAALAPVRVDVAFLGANGITLEHGFSTPDVNEAATKRAIVAAGRQVVVLADATKIGVEATVQFAGLSAVDVLVTDPGIAGRQRKELVAAGLEVVTP